MSRTHFLKLPNGLKINLNKNPKLSPDSINSVNLNQSLSQIEVNQGNVSEKNCVASKLKALFHSHKALFEADKGKLNFILLHRNQLLHINKTIISAVK